jgi:hypothetical protein
MSNWWVVCADHTTGPHRDQATAYRAAVQPNLSLREYKHRLADCWGWNGQGTPGHDSSVIIIGGGER